MTPRCGGRGLAVPTKNGSPQGVQARREEMSVDARDVSSPHMNAGASTSLVGEQQIA
jgi:hypothetical protein